MKINVCKTGKKFLVTIFVDDKLAYSFRATKDGVATLYEKFRDQLNVEMPKTLSRGVSLDATAYMTNN